MASKTFFKLYQKSCKNNLYSLNMRINELHHGLIVIIISVIKSIVRSYACNHLFGNLLACFDFMLKLVAN